MAFAFPRPKLSLKKLQDIFEEGGESPAAKAAQKKSAKAVLWYLDKGLVRVWDPATDQVNAWVKNAILAYFRESSVSAMNAGCFEFLDKLPPKKRVTMKGVRVVPGAFARFGSFIEAGAILMPSFVNIGAYVAKGTMIDTWATVGSCAQIGANVHLSGGVGIGGVLEPAQAKPVIVEEGAFVGSRCIVVEGVRIGTQAVLGAGVVLTASTKIVDVRGAMPVITHGSIPARAIVIPGTMPKGFPGGEFGVPCALIIGTRSESTDLKTSLNSALRDYDVAV